MMRLQLHTLEKDMVFICWHFFSHLQTLALHQLQQLDEAIIEYSKAITLYFELQMNSNDSNKNPFTEEMTSIVAEIHANRGLALYTKGFNEESLRDFERAIQLDSSLTAAHFNRGHALFKGTLYFSLNQQFRRKKRRSNSIIHKFTRTRSKQSTRFFTQTPLIFKQQVFSVAE